MISRRSVLLAIPAIWIGGNVRARPQSAPDPGSILQEPGNISANGYMDVSSRTLRSATINPAEKTLVMICAGQSLPTDNITATYNPTNASKIDNFIWSDGRLYNGVNPLLGTAWNGSVGTSANFNLPIADGIISNGKFDRVIMVPVAIPGSAMFQWTEDYVSGFYLGFYRMIKSAALKLAARGITPSTPGVKFLVKWNHGESDNQLGTTQAAYIAGFQKLKALCDPVLPGVKWMVARESWIAGVPSATIQAAQAALVDNVSVFVGENMDTIGNTGRIDTTHLNATGHDLAYPMGVTAITAITF